VKVISSSVMGFVPVQTEGAKGAHIKELITDREGAPTFVMRLFEVEPDGTTPHHSHEWEHEVFILKGEGELRADEGAHRFQAGDAVFVPGGEMHSFINTGSEALQFLCMIPVGKPSCK
jgi:quercetin dioxygenase-like cupin family protein